MCCLGHGTGDIGACLLPVLKVGHICPRLDRPHDACVSLALARPHALHPCSAPEIPVHAWDTIPAVVGRCGGGRGRGPAPTCSDRVPCSERVASAARHGPRYSCAGTRRRHRRGRALPRPPYFRFFSILIPIIRCPYSSTRIPIIGTRFPNVGTARVCPEGSASHDERSQQCSALGEHPYSDSQYPYSDYECPYPDDEYRASASAGSPEMLGARRAATASPWADRPAGRGGWDGILPSYSCAS
jgi:hypothetical protein